MNIDSITLSFYIVVFAMAVTGVYMFLVSLDMGLHVFGLFSVALLVFNAWFATKIISSDGKTKEEADT